MRILIVEDDVMPAHYLRDLLTANGHETVAIVDRGAQAIEMAATQSPDLILMDIMLKDAISGAEAAERIHRKFPKILIVFLTAYSDQDMIDYAVKSEAFSYLLKPYRDHEILATLSLAEAQRQAFPIREVMENDSILLAGGYEYSFEKQRLFQNNEEVKMGKKELALIDHLARNSQITLESDLLCQYLWGENGSGQKLRSLIHRIRNKTHPVLIQNSSRFGYRIGRKAADEAIN